MPWRRRRRRVIHVARFFLWFCILPVPCFIGMCFFTWSFVAVVEHNWPRAFFSFAIAWLAWAIAYTTQSSARHVFTRALEAIPDPPPEPEVSHTF